MTLQQNALSVANIGSDTVENGPSKNCTTDQPPTPPPWVKWTSTTSMEEEAGFQRGDILAARETPVSPRSTASDRSCGTSDEGSQDANRDVSDSLGSRR